MTLKGWVNRMGEPQVLYKLKGTNVIVEVLEVKDWDVIAKRLDNGKVDSYPIMYFKKHFV